MKHFFKTLFLIATLSFSGANFAGEKSPAVNLDIDPGNPYSGYTDAKLRSLAELDNMDATAMLGARYLYGTTTIKRDLKKAKGLLERAQDQSHDAANSLATMYLKGWGVTKDYLHAMKLYKQSMQMGSAQAPNNIGNMYHIGLGVTQDYDQALEYYQIALDRKCPGVLFNLGLLFAQSQKHLDVEKAVKLMQLASSIGDERAKKFLNDIGK